MPMQTFLPYCDFRDSLQALDDRRLGKQRVEAFQILNILLERTETKGWRNHPTILMWTGCAEALKIYFNISLEEWGRRGFRNNLPAESIENEIIVYPAWLGDPHLHASHRSNLLRKDFKFYSKYDWKEPPNLPYFWPTKHGY
jgi:hypothetical protein